MRLALIHHHIYKTKHTKSHSPLGSELSLNVGLGAMALSRKPSLGARPSGPSCMHIVPPVPMIKTRDSGMTALSGGESVTAGDMAGCRKQIFVKIGWMKIRRRREMR